MCAASSLLKLSGQPSNPPWLNGPAVQDLRSGSHTFSTLPFQIRPLPFSPPLVPPLLSPSFLPLPTLLFSLFISLIFFLPRNFHFPLPRTLVSTSVSVTPSHHFRYAYTHECPCISICISPLMASLILFRCEQSLVILHVLNFPQLTSALHCALFNVLPSPTCQFQFLGPHNVPQAPRSLVPYIYSPYLARVPPKIANSASEFWQTAAGGTDPSAGSAMCFHVCTRSLAYNSITDMISRVFEEKYHPPRACTTFAIRPV